MFAVAIYTLTLIVGSGIFGIFVRQVLGDMGYVHGFGMELVAAATVGCAYAAVELAYATFLRLFRPTRSPGPLITESVSQLAVAALLPYVLNIPLPMPHAILEKLGALLFLGAFAGAHAFLKLPSLYAAIRGLPARRFPALYWLTAMSACALFALVGAKWWMRALERERPKLTAAAEPQSVGGVWRESRAVPEGVEVADRLQLAPDTGLTFYWAPGKDAAAIDTAYVTIRFEAASPASYQAELALKPGEWASYHLGANQIPKGARQCRVTWSSEEPARWRKYVPVQPVAASDRTLLFSGPEIYRQRADQGGSNILLIVADGLGSNAISSFGYKRKTTPALDNLIKNTNCFPNAYTPVPDSSGACMTLLTGVSPLRHGYYGKRSQTPPATYKTMAELLAARQYATAAFTEGDQDGDRDLFHGSGFERGFMLFDSSCQGTESTLKKAKEWIAAHGDAQFFAFIRLRELHNCQWNDRYAPGFAAGPQSPAVDIYDSAVFYLDKQLGDFLRVVHASPGGPKTAIALTSSYGYDFTTGSGGQPVIGLTDDSLRVPLLLYLPDQVPERRKEAVGLEDLFATLAAQAGLKPDDAVAGQDLMKHPEPHSVISMNGEPVILSLRYGPWRFAWDSGYAPSTGAYGQDEIIELINVDRTRDRGYKTDDRRNNPNLTARYRQYLAEWLRKQVEARK